MTTSAALASEREQELEFLRDATRGFLTRYWPIEAVRASLEGPRTLDRDLWRRSAEMGWMIAALPAERGGLSGDALDAVVLAEELGRALFSARSWVPLWWPPCSYRPKERPQSGFATSSGAERRLPPGALPKLTAVGSRKR